MSHLRVFIFVYHPATCGERYANRVRIYEGWSFSTLRTAVTRLRREGGRAFCAPELGFLPTSATLRRSPRGRRVSRGHGSEEVEVNQQDGPEIQAPGLSSTRGRPRAGCPHLPT